MQEDEDAGVQKAAAARLLSLKRAGETDADFARRLDLSDQLVNNWRKKRNGLALDVLGRIAPRLSDAELVFVVAGRASGSSEAEAVAYARGLREAFQAAREQITMAEESVAATLIAPAESPPSRAAEAANAAVKRAGKGHPVNPGDAKEAT